MKEIYMLNKGEIKMKKMLNILVALFAAVVMFGCSTAKADDSGWYNDYDAAKKIASKQNKNVLLFVNSVYDIDGSQNAVKLLLETQSSNFLNLS